MYKFTNLQTAINFSNRCDKPMGIILGDDERYWVVTLAQMERLIADGYEAI